MSMFRTTHQHPVCRDCGQRHPPKTSTPEKKPIFVSADKLNELLKSDAPDPFVAVRTASPKPTPKPQPEMHTHEEWCRLLNVRDWKKTPNVVPPPPSLFEKVRAAHKASRSSKTTSLSRSQMHIPNIQTAASSTTTTDNRVPPPPSLFDAVRAAHKHGA